MAFSLILWLEGGSPFPSHPHALSCYLPSFTCTSQVLCCLVHHGYTRILGSWWSHLQKHLHHLLPMDLPSHIIFHLLPGFCFLLSHHSPKVQALCRGLIFYKSVPFGCQPYSILKQIDHRWSQQIVSVVTAEEWSEWEDQQLKDPCEYLGVTEKSEWLTLESGVVGFNPTTQELWLLLFHSFTAPLGQQHYQQFQLLEPSPSENTQD